MVSRREPDRTPGCIVMSRWHHPACLDDEQLLADCQVGTGRTGGPGGQHRNKVETEVVLTHVPSGQSAKAGERRSQIENRRVALKRLRLVLAVNVRTAVPIGEIGSELWRSRRQGQRIACNAEHRDLSSLLAEALDVISDAQWEPKKASVRLGVSQSQLIKLVQKHPPAFHEWNRQRQERSKHPLR